jgi:hypothetical protein
MQSKGCQCGGVLHRNNYPRKPRGCPDFARADFAWRFCFCCNLCRKRSTPMSVRFLGRRVYLSLAVVLQSARRAKTTTKNLCKTLAVPVRTLQRWRTWWVQLFPTTPLWQASCARFMPPVETADLPDSLIDRFSGSAAEAMIRLLTFLTPLTIQS